MKQDKSCQSQHWLHLSLEIRETCPLRKARLAWARGVLQDLRRRLSSQELGCPFNQPFISGLKHRQLTSSPASCFSEGSQSMPLRYKWKCENLLVLFTSIRLFTMVDGNLEWKRRKRARGMREGRKEGQWELRTKPYLGWPEPTLAPWPLTCLCLWSSLAIWADKYSQRSAWGPSQSFPYSH